MKAQNIIYGLVALTIAVIITVSAVVPIFMETTKTTDTFRNTGYYTYDYVNDDTDITIVWDGTTPDSLTIGDKVITMPTGNGNWTIVGSDNFTMRYYRSASTTGIQCYGVGGYFACNLTNSDGGTIQLTGSSMVVTRDDLDVSTKTYSVGNHPFVINAFGSGPLTLKYSDETAYIKDDSEIYLCGTTYVTGSGTNDFVGVFGYGTVDEITLSSFYGNTGQNVVSFGDATINAVAVSSHIDLYQISNVTFPLTQNGATVTANYSYFVVPSEVTAERSVHPDAPTSTIINLIPLIIVAGILLLAIVYFIRRA